MTRRQSATAGQLPVRIRVETQGDRPAVADLHRTAFGGDVVPDLVEALRGSAGFVPELSLVADANDDSDAGGAGRPDVVGHVMLTWVGLETEAGGSRDVLCLSPLAVGPQAQGTGIGRALVEAACAAADAAGEPFVVLEGNPARYARFGFVAASSRGLRRPSERIPEPAFQVRCLGADDPASPALRGRVLYPDVFWDAGAIGLPMAGPAFLDTLERQCRDVERLLVGAAGGAIGGARGGGPDGAVALAAPVPACPGWTVADLLGHLGVIHRFVPGWIAAGRRPTVRPEPPANGAELVGWFGQGWRALHDLLDARPADTPTATWSPWDATAGFWRRRMAHETAIHALDVAQALSADQALSAKGLAGNGSVPWSVPDDIALDGIDEVVRLWLGTRLGADVRGSGGLVRLVAVDGAGAPQRFWTVGLHHGVTETNEVPTPPDATVTGRPAALYAWLWGRASDADVATSGSASALADLRAALAGALQ